MTFKILSLDGGGSWALIQVRTLIELFDNGGDGSNVFGHDVLRHYDLVVANSGGTLTLGGLIRNWSLSDLLDMFMNEEKRKQIFVRATFCQDPVAHLINPLGVGAKYYAPAKLEGLRALLGTVGDRAVTDVPDIVGEGYAGRAVHVVLCAFDYNANREVFFRSDSESLAASRAPRIPAGIAQAIHASSNAPANYFDAPAIGPQHNLYWDGAVGGYNNPALAGAIEAVANAARYHTSRESIRILSIGTANAVLPMGPAAAGEDPDLFVQLKPSNIKNDILKLATSILDDPPDAATFHAHLLLGSPLPGPHDPLPINDRIVRMNPLIQPVPVPSGQNVSWACPPGMSKETFVALRDLSMDAVEQIDVERISALCDLWFADSVPNQPIRANSADLSAEIGFDRFGDALAAAKALGLA